MLGIGRRAKPDPLARKIALEIGGSRILIGAGALLATRPVLRMFGFGGVGPPAVALGRLNGGRDVALGALTVAARNDPERLRTLIFVSSACDLADALGLGLSAGPPETRRAGIGGAISGSAAALAGFWAWRRLAP
jgi:hypothetical protein